MSNMPAGSTINTIHYYISGGMNYSITYEELGIIASFKENDTTLSAKSGSFFRMPGYTVVLVEHMGGGNNRFFVDAVIDGEEYSDEAIHQLLPRMQNGFVLYVPDDAWTNGIPSRGDIVTAGWRNNADVFSYDRTADSAVSWPSVNRSNTPFANPYEICFYRNPAEDAQGNAVVRPLGADTVNAVADVNATVQMFNYGANVNAEGNPLSFWNGFWGYGGEVESIDGSGIEDSTYRFPAVSRELGADGYPAFYTYVEDQDGTFYKTRDGKIVPLTEAGDYSNVMTDRKYRLENTEVSLGYLFGKDVSEENYGIGNANGVTAYRPQYDGAGLFRYDPITGNYFYDSMQNAASYDTATNRFTIYDNLIVRPWYNSNNGEDYDYSVPGFSYDKYVDAGYASGTSVSFPESYGNFLPFNMLTPDNVTLDGAVYDYNDRNADDRFVSTEDFSAAVLASPVSGTLEAYGLIPAAAQKVLASNKSLGVASVNEMVSTYGNRGLYTGRIQDKVDMWFGMYVGFDFYQPQKGRVQTASGVSNDMIFDFEGDDDVFVYVGLWDEAQQNYDYKLVLDIGGIHEARNGYINFATGDVVYTNCYGKDISTTLGQLFDLEGDTFEDFTKLSLKFFYMERGGNISCCRLNFNIPTLPENSLTIGKALDQEVLGTQSYGFRVLKATENGTDGELLIGEGTEYTITGTNQKGQVGKDGIILLAPGQSVTFEGEHWYTSHCVVEEIITGEVDGQFTTVSPVCAVNGSNVAVTEISGDGYFIYRTAPIAINNISSRNESRSSNMTVVGFTNLIRQDQLGTLKITKKIAEGASIDAGTSFDMRVTVGGRLLPVGTEYTVNGNKVIVTKAGIISLKADETAEIKGILSTSAFQITEVSYNAAPTYTNPTKDPTVVCTSNGASGTMPLGGVVEILVTNDDSSGLIVDKTVVAGADDENFVLTLEAFATGTTSTFTSTKPADIVLVLDQSSTMYTPMGWAKDRVNLENGDTNISVNNTLRDKYAITDFVEQANTSGSDVQENAKRLGYYIAFHNGEAANYMYLVHYAQNSSGEWGWYYISVDQTSRSINDALIKTQYDAPSQDSALYGAEYKVCAWDNAAAVAGFTYYKTQFGALAESVEAFVSGLKASGVAHRVGIVGFSSPFYDGRDGYEGTGIYVDGEYYIYDTSFDDPEFIDSNGYFNPDSPQIDGVSPDEQKQYLSAEVIAAIQAKSAQRVYGSALVDVSTLEGFESILKSVDALRTNYQQTCPAIGIEIA